MNAWSESIMSKTNPILWIIVPCYNEEAVLPITAPLFR